MSLLIKDAHWPFLTYELSNKGIRKTFFKFFRKKTGYGISLKKSFFALYVEKEILYVQINDETYNVSSVNWKALFKKGYGADRKFSLFNGGILV